MSTDSYTDDQLKQVARLLAQHFIARSDAVAEQHSDGSYSPIRKKTSPPGEEDTWELVPVQMAHLMNHLRGNASVGHYLLNKVNQCKLMVFDIDIDKDAPHHNSPIEEWCMLPTLYIDGEYREFFRIDGRTAWKNNLEGFGIEGGPTVTRDMQFVMRDFLRFQLRKTADVLVQAIRDHLCIPVMVAYSGNKGLHVYGLTGLTDAKDVREGAEIVAEAAKLTPHKGQNFWKPESTFAEPCSVTVEIFPKQTEIADGGFGNLVCLPLGRNKKNPKHPKFFCSLEDQGPREGVLVPMDTLRAFELAFEDF